jgi:hypothetical protein
MTLPFALPGRWLSESLGQEMATVYKDIKPDLDQVEEQLESWSRSETR